MTDLTQAIADVKAQIDENLPYSMISDDPLRIAENTILNAVASGELVVRADIELGLSDPVAVHYSMAKGTIAKPSLAQICHVYTGELIPLADHKLAVAMVVEKAAQSGYVACAETRHVSLGNKVRDTICALIPDDALAEVQALWAEITDLKLNMDADLRTMVREGTALKAAEAELAATQAKLARVVEALSLAANRLLRCSVDYDAGTKKFIEVAEWAKEARAELTTLEGAKP